ncbi:MAG: D-alanyl-D-alanine carboxypeptidase family protein [Gammaproteobacteria bacterium]
MTQLVVAMVAVWGAMTATAAPIIIPAAPQIGAESYLVIDAATGDVLASENARMRLPPASLTKIMTSYIIADEIEQGRITLDDRVPISVKAWRMEGSRMFIREGTEVSVADLLRGIVIQSGNDASVAMAEYIAGDEEAFAGLMTQTAKSLGMNNTNFMNATGLPDEMHYTTAEDLAILTRALINRFPEHYAIYSEKYFSYNDIRQANRNALLWRDDSVDGVKTGHTQAAGYCLVASAMENDTRLISVVMGARDERTRAAESQKLLNYGFRYYETVNLYAAGSSLKRVRVWSGLHESVEVGLDDAITLTIPRGGRDQLKAEINLQDVIEAPIERGQTLGALTLSLGDEMLVERPVVALNPVQAAGWLSSTLDDVQLMFIDLTGGDPLAP